MFDNIKKLREIFTRHEKMQIGVLLIAIIVMAFLKSISVASVLPFIGLVMEPNMVFENSWLLLVYNIFGFSSINRLIIFTGFIMFLIILTSNAFSAYTTWIKLRFVWMNNHRLSRRLLKKYLLMPYAVFLNQNSSDLSKNVLNEINQLTSNYLLPLLDVITKCLIALFIFAMLFWINIVVSLLAVIFVGGIYAALYWQVNKNLRKRGEVRFEANQMRFKVANEVFGGIKEIKVLNRKPLFLERFSCASYSHAQQMSWNAAIGQLPRFILEAVAFGGIIIFILFLLLTRDDIRQVIPLAGVFAFAGYRLIPAIQDIFTGITKMRFNQVVIDRTYNDLKVYEKNDLAQTDIISKNLPKHLSFYDKICLKNLSYNYPNTSIPVIEKINLNIEYNTSVAFVGLSGAGKTTLVDIILGLLPPQQGQILVDGLPIDENNLVNWQRTIGYVPQQIYLSDGTVASNIAFGLPGSEIEQDQLEWVAQIANIYDFITQELPNGFDTLVGERGVRLSGGQCQRIGIARALYHNPDLLIFDEATSALDTITEDAVLNAMENAAKLKTLIIIAHRLTTVKNCDIIYILDKGKIVAYGTYDQLIGSNKLFQKMAKIRK